MGVKDQEARGELAGAAWQAVFGLFFQGVGQRRFHQACDAAGLAPGQVKALLALEPDNPSPMRDLAETFGCDPSYITSLVDGLEEAGLAERRHQPQDRRVRVVALTDRGVEAQTDIRKILFEPPEAFDVLTAHELGQLRDLLTKIREAPPSVL